MTFPDVDYIRWAKEHPPARINLARSGVALCPPELLQLRARDLVVNLPVMVFAKNAGRMSLALSLEGRLRYPHVNTIDRLVDELRDGDVAGDAHELIGLVLRQVLVLARKSTIS